MTRDRQGGLAGKPPQAGSLPYITNSAERFSDIIT